MFILKSILTSAAALESAAPEANERALVKKRTDNTKANFFISLPPKRKFRIFPYALQMFTAYNIEISKYSIASFPLKVKGAPKNFLCFRLIHRPSLAVLLEPPSDFAGRFKTV